MKPLRKLQAEFARDVLTGGSETLSLVRDRMDISAAERFDVYRNNILASLSEVLAQTFPAVQALAGEEFFRAMARHFVMESPPENPVLSNYGSAFPAFIERYQPAAAHPYFADVARLEWARNLVQNAQEEEESVESLRRCALEEFMNTGLRLSHEVRLVCSPYPVETIRRWTESPRPETEAVNLSQGPERVIVWRKGYETCSETLPASAYAFIALLETGSSLSAALEQVLTADPGFDAGQWTGRMLSEGWVRKAI